MLKLILYQHTFQIKSAFSQTQVGQSLFIAPSAKQADSIKDIFPVAQTKTLFKFLSSYLPEEIQVYKKSELLLDLAKIWKSHYLKASYAQYSQAFSIITEVRGFTIDQLLMQDILEHYDVEFAPFILTANLYLNQAINLDEARAFLHLLSKCDAEKSLVFYDFKILNPIQVDVLNQLAEKVDIFITLPKRVFEGAIESDWVKWLKAEVIDVSNENATQASPFVKSFAPYRLIDHLDATKKQMIYFLGSQNKTIDYFENPSFIKQNKAEILLFDDILEEVHKLFERTNFTAEECEEWIKQKIYYSQNNYRFIKALCLLREIVLELKNLELTLDQFEKDLVLKVLRLRLPRHNLFELHQELPQKLESIFVLRQKDFPLKKFKWEKKPSLEHRLKALGPVPRSELNYFYFLQSFFEKMSESQHNTLFYENGIELKDVDFAKLLSLADTAHQESTLEIKKDEVIVNESWEGSYQGPLSSTNLQSFIDCPKKFYFQYIKKWQENLEYFEILEEKEMGQVEHKVIENYFKRSKTWDNNIFVEVLKETYSSFTEEHKKNIKIDERLEYFSELEEFCQNGILQTIELMESFLKCHWAFEYKIEEPEMRGSIDLLGVSDDTVVIVDYKRSKFSIPGPIDIYELRKIQLLFYQKRMKLKFPNHSFVMKYICLSNENDSTQFPKEKNSDKDTAKMEKAFLLYDKWENETSHFFKESNVYEIKPAQSYVCENCFLGKVCAKGLIKEKRVRDIPEQKKAIEAQGNVLLSAGAGSGKTHVLVNHFLFKVENYLQKEDKDIQSFLRSFVLMTFTNKAAFEIKARIQVAVMEKQKHDPSWSQISDNLDYLFVGTIHSFCLKLLRLNLVEGWSEEDRLIDDFDENYRIEKALSFVIQKKMAEGKAQDVIRYKKQILQALQGVFGSNELRVLWENFPKQGITIEHFFKEYLRLLEISVGFHKSPLIYLEDIEKYQSKEYFLSLHGLIESEIKDYEWLKRLCDWATRRAETIRKDKYPELSECNEEVKKFKDAFKKISESILAYFDHEKNTAHEWSAQIFEIYSEVKDIVERGSGKTFNDLEFLVWKNIDKNQGVKKVRDYFKYFIVDEFQDTSPIQYAIFEKISDNNWQNFYFVGDVKQAIYSFRGGDINVFVKASKNVVSNLIMQNNFRSASEIVHFNNDFFESIMKTPGYPFERQVPAREDIAGHIMTVKTKLHLDAEEKVSNRKLEYTEACALIHWIMSHPKASDIAVLYRKRKPSLLLIALLKNYQIGFTTKSQIFLLDDPILGVFKSFIERLMNTHDSSIHLFDFKMAIYQEKLQIKDFNYHECFDSFQKDLELFGIWGAWIHFLHHQKITVATSDQSLNLIQKVIYASSGNIEFINRRMSKLSSYKYEMENVWGENPSRIKIMTVHASKGLQFENVLLGGIYTDQKSANDSDLFGEYPQSFKWFEKKKKYETPNYILEKMEADKIKKAEAIRLLYVACTRPIKNLVWVTLENFAAPSFSWAHYLGQSSGQENMSFDQNFQFTYNDFLPAYFLDTLGISNYPKNLNHIPVILPDLSITKLAKMSLCSMYFYFESFLKISDKDLSFIKSVLPKKDDLSPAKKTLSSAKKGIEAHETIQYFLENEDNNNLNKISSFFKEQLTYIKENKKYTVEREIKFSFFGHIVQGRADLIIMDSVPRVVDFKTGDFCEEMQKTYLTQIYFYAMGLWAQGELGRETLISVEIFYLDLDIIKKTEITVEEIISYLWSHIALKMNKENLNLNYCKKCKFEMICQKRQILP